jgi:hypothetical protein
MNRPFGCCRGPLRGRGQEEPDRENGRHVRARLSAALVAQLHPRRCASVLLAIVLVLLQATPGVAQIKAKARSGATPPWGKGILPISPESYYNAIACGKQGGEDPPCVFFDTGLCQNDDFTLALFTPYKKVAYEVWQAVRQKQPAPQPNYQAAQTTRVTIAVTPARGSKNPLTALALKRGGRTVAPVDRSLDNGGGRYTFDFPAFAATGDVTLDLMGQVRTVSCLIEQSVLAQLR